MSWSTMVGVRFVTNYDVGDERHVIAVVGSYEYLGSWKPKNGLLLEKQGTKPCWSQVIWLPLNEYFEWKMVVVDKDTLEVIRWEECENRWNWIDRGPLEIVVGWNSRELIRCLAEICLTANCSCRTWYTYLDKQENLVDVTFYVSYSYDSLRHSLMLIGSTEFLGNWNPIYGRCFVTNHNNALTVKLPKSRTFEWKLAVVDKRYRSVTCWETCPHRTLHVRNHPLHVHVVWNQASNVQHFTEWFERKLFAIQSNRQLSDFETDDNDIYDPNDEVGLVHAFEENDQSSEELNSISKSDTNLDIHEPTETLSTKTLMLLKATSLC